MLLLAWAGTACPLQSEVLLKTDDALERAFPAPLSVEIRWVTVSSNHAEKINRVIDSKTLPSVLKYYEASDKKGIAGYAAIDSTSGKHGPIKFLLVVNLDMTVRSVTILSHREKRGRPIKERRFLSQFTGKKMFDRFRINSDIHGVTGATISSRAVATGVKKVLAYLTVLLGSEEGVGKKDDP